MTVKTNMDVYKSPRRTVKELLRRRIESLKWQPGQKVPSEAQLAHTFGISSATIHRAMRELQEEGLIVCQKGSKERRVRTFDDYFKTGVVGLLHFDRSALGHPIMQQRLRGIEEVLREHGLRMRIEVGDHYHAEYDPLPGSNELDTVCRGLDGLIVHWCHADFTPLTRVSSLLPVIITENESLGPRVAGVSSDHELAHFLLTDALLRAEHRRIGRLGLPKSMWPAGAQATGMRVAVGQRPYEGKPVIEHIPVRHHEIDCAQAEIKKLLREQCLPSALVCASDELAQGALNALSEGGLEVPDDVSVVCYGSEEPAVRLSQSLTSVRTDFVELGRATARKLLEMINANDELIDRHEWPETVHLPCRFVEGGSIA